MIVLNTDVIRTVAEMYFASIQKNTNAKENYNKHIVSAEPAGVPHILANIGNRHLCITRSSLSIGDSTLNTVHHQHQGCSFLVANENLGNENFRIHIDPSRYAFISSPAGRY